MKILLLLSLLLVCTFQKASTTSYLQCQQNIDFSKCNEDCKKDLEKCNDEDGDVRTSDQCKDFEKELEKKVLNDPSSKWGDQMGADFHGCAQNCIDEISGEAKKLAEKKKACYQNVLQAVFGILALLIASIL